MLHEISRTYHRVRDISLIKEYFSEKERLGQLCRSVDCSKPQGWLIIAWV